MRGRSYWANLPVHLYYFLGLSYYIYHWYIIAGGAGILASLVGAYFSGPYVSWLILGASSVLLLAIGVAILFSNWRKRYKNINSGLKILSSHSTYGILPDNKYQYRRELEVVASIHSVDHFTHVFGWTGGGGIDVAADNGFRAELSDDPISTKKRLRIYFDRPRARGERFRISYRFEMEDREGVARKFLRTTLHEKIRKLTSEIVFPAASCPTKYKKAIYMSNVAEIPIYEEDIPMNRDENSITWTVMKPRLGFDYCISW